MLQRWGWWTVRLIVQMAALTADQAKGGAAGCSLDLASELLFGEHLRSLQGQKAGAFHHLWFLEPPECPTLPCSDIFCGPDLLFPWVYLSSLPSSCRVCGALQLSTGLPHKLFLCALLLCAPLTLGP